MRFVMVTITNASGEHDVMLNMDKVVYFHNNKGFVAMQLDSGRTIVTRTLYDTFVMGLRQLNER